MAGNNSAAMKARYATTTREQRMALVAAAHAARRGQRESLAVRERRAKKREEQRIGIGPHEQAFARMLDVRRIKYRQQTALGPYCMDFTVDEGLVAVEIVSGSGNTRVARNRPQRIESVLEKHHLFEVRFSSGGPRVVSERVVDQLVAFLDETRGNEAGARQHRVVRPNGDLYPTRRYGNGRPIAISEEQISSARFMFASGLVPMVVWRLTGIPRRRLYAMAGDLGYQGNRRA